MKRKITLKATGESSEVKVTIDLVTDGRAMYTRGEATVLALNIADDIAVALAKRYRATKIRTV